MLEALGASVWQAENGLEALKQLRAEPCDIVFLDIRMPVMNGIEALKRIRKEWPQPQPVCIALTASALLHERDSYMLEGFDEFIGKPFLFETIYTCLRKQLPGHFGSASPVQTPAPNVAGTPHLPPTLRARLIDAVNKGWLSELEAGIEELRQLGAAEQALAERLAIRLLHYDMAGLGQELAALVQDE
jgi:CheY-like chemotaxis protein